MNPIRSYGVDRKRESKAMKRGESGKAHGTAVSWWVAMFHNIPKIVMKS